MTSWKAPPPQKIHFFDHTLSSLFCRGGKKERKEEKKKGRKQEKKKGETKGRNTRKKRGKKEWDVSHPNYPQELGPVSSKLSPGSWSPCVLDVARKSLKAESGQHFGRDVAKTLLSALFCRSRPLSDKSQRIDENRGDQEPGDSLEQKHPSPGPDHRAQKKLQSCTFYNGTLQGDVQFFHLNVFPSFLLLCFG